KLRRWAPRAMGCLPPDRAQRSVRQGCRRVSGGLAVEQAETGCVSVSWRGRGGGVPGDVEKGKGRILPVDEVHDQPAAQAGGHRRNAPWGSVSASWSERMSLSPSR